MFIPPLNSCWYTFSGRLLYHQIHSLIVLFLLIDETYHHSCELIRLDFICRRCNFTLVQNLDKSWDRKSRKFSHFCCYNQNIWHLSLFWLKSDWNSWLVHRLIWQTVSLLFQPLCNDLAFFHLCLLYRTLISPWRREAVSMVTTVWHANVCVCCSCARDGPPHRHQFDRIRHKVSFKCLLFLFCFLLYMDVDSLVHFQSRCYQHWYQNFVTLRNVSLW